MMRVCKGDNPFCGWTDDGRFECYCYSPPTDKLSRIRKIVDDALVWKECHLEAGRTERAFAVLTEALWHIREIVDEKAEGEKGHE